MDMLGDDQQYRQRKLRDRLSLIGNSLWIMAGLAMLALTGYRAWDQYDQRQRANAFVAGAKARDVAFHRESDKQLARWRKVIDKLERVAR